MRLLLALVIGVAALPGVVGLAAGAHAPKPHPLLLQTTTGRIAEVGLSEIAVGGMKCSFTPKSAVLAGGFAVGENVRIGCLRKVLQTIKLQPVTNGHALPSITITAPATVKTPSPSSGAQSAVTSSQSAHGAITAVTPTSITIGDVTCPFNPAAAQLGVGEVIQMTCETLADGNRLGSIVLPLS